MNCYLLFPLLNLGHGTITLQQALAWGLRTSTTQAFAPHVKVKLVRYRPMLQAMLAGHQPSQRKSYAPWHPRVPRSLAVAHLP